MISAKEYLKTVEENLLHYFSEKYNDITHDDDLEVIQVWMCKTIQNHKGLFIVKNTKSGMIYDNFIEATYNGDADELYLDFYKKEFKLTVYC